jgi:glycosyltransferase involved in cell wall biosynthesis
MKPLLSIVVPTKDRYEFLKPLIILIKSFEYEEIELIIQDNTKDNEEIIEFLKNFNYTNLKYFHTLKQISIARNCDLGILNSTGKYVCLIGDDDGVSGHILSAVKFMDIHKIDVLKTAQLAYKWPGYNSSKVAKFSSVLFLAFYNKRFKRLNPHNELIKTLKNGGNVVNMLPKVYHGISSRATLDKVYSIGGTFFPGSSPDMANAVAMSFVTNNFVYLDFPVIIPGNSQRSGGDARKHNNGFAEISSVPFLPENTEKNWENFIPKIWCAETIMPETACKALKYMGKANFIEENLNIEKMLAFSIVQNSRIFSLAIGKSNNKFLLIYYLFYLFSVKILKGLFNKAIYNIFSIVYFIPTYSGGIFNYKNYLIVIKKINSIKEANDYILKTEPIFETHFSQK